MTKKNLTRVTQIPSLKQDINLSVAICLPLSPVDILRNVCVRLLLRSFEVASDEGNVATPHSLTDCHLPLSLFLRVRRTQVALKWLLRTKKYSGHWLLCPHSPCNQRRRTIISLRGRYFFLFCCFLETHSAGIRPQNKQITFCLYSIALQQCTLQASS